MELCQPARHHQPAIRLDELLVTRDEAHPEARRMNHEETECSDADREQDVTKCQESEENVPNPKGTMSPSFPIDSGQVVVYLCAEVRISECSGLTGQQHRYAPDVEAGRVLVSYLESS